jgi:hypothetical protein
MGLVDLDESPKLVFGRRWQRESEVVATDVDAKLVDSLRRTQKLKLLRVDRMSVNQTSNGRNDSYLQTLGRNNYPGEGGIHLTSYD